MKNKKLLFSMTKKDFEVTWFKAPGNGGQKKNKTKSACRIKHKETGILATCSDYRESHKNKEEAFNRLYNCPEFQNYMRIRIAKETTDQVEQEKKLKELMQDDNLKIEVFEGGKWVEKNKESHGQFK